MSHPQQPAPVQHIQVIVPQQRQSQALPALVSFFFPGVGQLIQGRLFAFLLFQLAWWVGIGLCFVCVGVVVVPVVGLVATLDAAWYDPLQSGGIMGFVGAVVALGAVAVGVVLFMGGVGALAVATSQPPPAPPVSAAIPTAEPAVLPPADEIRLPAETAAAGAPATPPATDAAESPAAVSLPASPAPAPAAANPKRRTWASATGQFSTEADFVSFGAGNVKLRKLDGAEITVALDRLSEADQKWIRDYMRGK